MIFFYSKLYLWYGKRPTPRSTMPNSDSNFSITILKACMEVFVCQKMGEETVYMRNLKKQASLKNNDAISLLSAVQCLKSVETRLLNIIKDFRLIGLQNLAMLLQNLQHLAKPDFYDASAWTLCSFTGKICANVIYFELDNVKYYADETFRYFLYTFWVCFNIRTLEHARAAAYMTANSSTAMSMHERITKFMQDQNDETDKAAQLYSRCLSYTLDSMEKTMENHRITMTCLPGEEHHAGVPTEAPPQS